MRILMVSDVFFPRINGVSTSIKTFYKELTELGHEVTLISPAYGKNDGNHEWIYRIPSRYIPMDPEDRMMKRAYIHELRDTLIQKDYDIVHIQTPFVAHYAGIDLARRLNVPRVETYHTHFEEYLYHYLPWLPKSVMRFSARWFNRKQCNDVDGLIVPSRAMLEVLTDYGITQPMEIIATGIDANFFKPGDGARFRAEHGIDQTRPVLVHVGRVAHEKNIGFLLHMLDALRLRIPDVLLIVAGEGPAEKHLRDLAATLKLGNNIKFVGYLDRSGVLLDCYRAGDVFVFGSKTETQGLVLLEAMAQGVPVVSIAALGTTDILDAGKGALVAEEQTTDFADKVADVLQNTGLHKTLSEEAKLYARTWAAREFALKAVRFYERAIHDYQFN